MQGARKMRFNSRKNILMVVILLILSLALTDCSGSGQEKTKSEPPKAAEQKQAGAEEKQANVSPEATVQKFYNLVTNRQYDSAYACLSDKYKSSLNFNNWVAGYANTISNEIVWAKYESGSEQSAKVNFRLKSRDKENSRILVQTFEGYWNLKRIDAKSPWLLDEASVKRVERYYEGEENQAKNLVGGWKDSKYPQGITLDIKTQSGNQISGTMYCSRNNGAQIAQAKFSGTLNNNTLICPYDEDGWGNSGQLNIKVEDKQIVVTVTQLKKSGGLWALLPGTYYMNKD